MPAVWITGEIAGVHTKGGALPVGGFSSGTAIGAIRAPSNYNSYF
jgi:hypothetical protein